MGMYDSFYAPVTCPKCKNHFPEGEIQTKDGVCVLNRFHIGNRVEGMGGIETGVLNERWYCDNSKCNHSTPWGELPKVKIFIRDWIFIGIAIEDTERTKHDKHYNFDDTKLPDKLVELTMSFTPEELDEIESALITWYHKLGQGSRKTEVATLRHRITEVLNQHNPNR